MPQPASTRAGEHHGEAPHTTTSCAPATSRRKLGIEITPASPAGVGTGGLHGGRAGPDAAGGLVAQRHERARERLLLGGEHVRPAHVGVEPDERA